MKDGYAEVGRVIDLYCHPVKSMRGQCLTEARLGFHGIALDREYAFLKEDDVSGLPWLSARDLPSLVRYEPFVERADERGEGDIQVRTPSAKILPLRDPTLVAELIDQWGGPLRLVRLWSRMFDAMDVSIISQRSISAISETIREPLDPRRFRPNIVIEALGERAFPEDNWVGETLVFGDAPEAARISVTRKDLRCNIVNIDPGSGEENLPVLKEIVSRRKNLVGAYGTALRTGTIRVGDTVFLDKRSR